MTQDLRKSPDALACASASGTAQRWPDLQTSEWADNQFNSALRNDAAITYAEAALRSAGLPLHPDRPKNWDTILALIAALRVDQQAPILDAGAEIYSSFLPALCRMGYINLIGINLAFQAEIEIGDIKYQNGDITNTNFPASAFGFIACLSVIEHGVDLKAFIKEAARILATGGYLFISTDYWERGLQTFGREAYGVPVKVFNASEISELVKLAQAAGLEPLGVINHTCNDRVVHWSHVDLRYTFMNILLQKKGING